MTVLKDSTQDQLLNLTDCKGELGFCTSSDLQTHSKESLQELLSDPRSSFFLSSADGQITTVNTGQNHSAGDQTLSALCPQLTWQQLGDATFCSEHRLRYAYMCGAMANGIASAELVAASANAGFLGSYGAAGQSLDAINTAIDYLEQHCGENNFCINLIHSPNEPEHEGKVVDLFIKRGITLIEASAYLNLTPAVIRYRLHGIYRDDNGIVQAPNKIIAKASRIEVATRWWNPPPEKMIAELLAKSEITAEQAELAKEIPMAVDLTAEADSGGHTDNRPALCMFPTFLALRDQIQQTQKYSVSLRLGLGGGIGTPSSAAAAFSMGAAYIVTGSVNQACVESGSSDNVRKMLAGTEQADVTMAPAADMFEMGVKLQVLKRGTFFPMRAEKLYTLYKSCASLEDIPPADKKQLEEQFFKTSIDDIWQQTQSFFNEREPKQIEKALKDPKHKMALVFRWYLGKSSRWANAGDATRQMDYQVWCGPAMGAFNEWAKNSCLEQAENRNVKLVAYNILHGCCLHLRLQMLKQQGVGIHASLFAQKPLSMDVLERFA